MDDVLSEQVDPTGAAPEASPAGAPSEATTEPTPAPEISEEIQTLIEQRATEAAEKVKAEYEGKGGHLARLKAAKDKELARLKKQLRDQQKGKVEEAKALIESNPDQAAQILLSLAEEQDQQIAQDSAQSELIDWQQKILADLGADPAEDEEAAALVAEWGPRLIEDPNLTWDYQQAAAQLQLERERAANKEVTKELKDLKDGLGGMVNAAVTRALVEAGVVPEPTPDGGAPPKEEDWRDLSPAQLRKKGLEERRKAPMQRT